MSNNSSRKFECAECGQLVPEGGHHVCRKRQQDDYVYNLVGALQELLENLVYAYLLWMGRDTRREVGWFASYALADVRVALNRRYGNLPGLRLAGRGGGVG